MSCWLRLQNLELAATPLSVLGSDEGPDAKKRCAKSRSPPFSFE